MKRNSRDSWASKAIVLAGCLAVGGCSEAMQKKFIRQKKAEPRPSPVTQFEDYQKGITPLDQYRKHYLMFDYWNAQLLDSLLPTGSNPKRVCRASTEALYSLRQLVALLQEPLAAEAQPLLEQRQQLDRELQDKVDDSGQLSLLRQRMELNQRRIHRIMAVGKVEDRLKVAVPKVAPQPAASSDPPIPAAGEEL